MNFLSSVVLVLASTAQAFAPPAAARTNMRVQPTMAVPMGINGFGRIGRLVARIMSKDPNCDLKLINTGASAEYMAYQMKYDTIHGKYPGTIDADGDNLVIDEVKAMKMMHDGAVMPALQR